MKDHRGMRRRVSLLFVFFFFFFCTLLVFGAITIQLLMQGYQPRLVSKWKTPSMEMIVGENSATPAISVRETVLLPDEALIFLKYPLSTALYSKVDVTCIYSSPNSSRPQPQLEQYPAKLESRYENDLQIVRCPLPPRGNIVSLAVNHNGHLTPGPTYRWNSLAYEAILDEDNSTVVFVKGLHLRSGKAAAPSKYKCHYVWDLTQSNSVLLGDVVSAAQEIVRCRTPLSVLNTTPRFGSFNDHIKVSVKAVGKRALNSVARMKLGPSPTLSHTEKQHKLCVCTMLRNQARFLPEWVMYHARIGVQRWFIYDNNSNDDLERVVDSLVSAHHNVTRHIWPWIKSQEAGFAHCALRSRESCQWVAFIDVDEFFHIPSHQHSLHDVISNYSAGDHRVGEIRAWCRNFGPSGLKKHPEKGVMTGYTCRAAAPERHKSIIRPEGLNSSLINVVHHFHLKLGYRVVTMNTSTLVINHYKYQVWEVFKEKFYRRVATYVSDWKEERNVESKDRAPGLGTKAIEPVDWSTRFCEVKDTGLRDRVLQTFADSRTGLLPWENYSSAR